MRVTVTEGARALGLSHSTVSRQLVSFGIARDEDGRFPLEAYQAARAGGIEPARQGSHAGLLLGEAPSEPDAPEPGAPTYRAVKADREGVMAELARLDLAERQGKLVPLEVVEQRERELLARVEQASVTLRDALVGLSLRISGALVSMTDAAEIRGLLDQEHRALLEGFADGCSAGDDAGMADAA